MNTNTKTNTNTGITMFHEITVVGRVGQKLEVRQTPAGEGIFEFWVECVREYQSGMSTTQETQKFKVSLWGNEATFYAPKIEGGAMLKIRGRLLCNPHTGGPRVYLKNGGEQSAAFEVRAREITFLGQAKK